jgi:hypothetical protein
MPPVVATPTVPVQFVQAQAGEIISLGKIKLRVMEDGSNTGKISPLMSLEDTHACFHVIKKNTFLTDICISSMFSGKSGTPPPNLRRQHDLTHSQTTVFQPSS